MKPKFLLPFALLILAPLAFGQTNYLFDHQSKEWRELIKRGMLPYHQLHVEDFSVRPESPTGAPVWTQQFLSFRHDVKSQPCDGGNICAQVGNWRIYSGMNQPASGRLGGDDKLEERLPYLQVLSDIQEVHARKLAATPLEKLPTGRGKTRAEALTDLNQKLRAFCTAESTAIRKEKEKYIAATRSGTRASAVRRWERRLTKRLANYGLGR